MKVKWEIPKENNAVFVLKKELKDNFFYRPPEW